MATDLQIPELKLRDPAARRRSSRTRRASSELVEIMTATAGLVALFASNASPAGITLADGLYRGAFAAAVVWFASRSKRWTWGMLSAVAATAAATLLTQLLALLGVGTVIYSIYKRKRSPQLGATIALLSLPALFTQGVGPLFRLTGGLIVDPFATSAIITTLAVAPIFRTGWRTISRWRRRTVKKRVIQVGIGTGTLVGISGLICVLAIPSLLRGLESTQIGADAATNGDLAAATERLEQASKDWSRANRIISGPWTLPARLVPVVGQNLRAGQVATGQASALSESAASVTGRVDPTALVANGAVRVDELDRISPAFDALAATLVRAEDRIGAIDTPWLFGPIAQRIDRANEVLARSAGVIGASSESLHVARNFLGGSEPRQMLVMFTTPAEARGSGGFVGSWAVVETFAGRLSVERIYRSVELNNLLEANNAELSNTGDYARRYGRFEIATHIQDVTISPDFPSVAEVAADLFEQATGTTVDGVISIDPFVIEKLVGLSGPIQTEGRSLTGANAANELLVEQYVRYADDEAGREQALLALTDELTSMLFAEPPDPLAFVTELAPLADQDRVNLWLANDPDSEVTGKLGLSGAFPEPVEDLIAVVHQNGGQNKIDSFLERSLAIETVLNPTAGTVEHELTINLENLAPSSGLPDAILASNDQGLATGTNRMILSTYSRHPIVEAQLDGEPIPVEADTEFGVGVYSVVVDLGPGEQATLEFDIAGSITNEQTYDITLGSQPLVSNELIEWTMRTTDGSRIDGPDDWTSNLAGLSWSSNLDRDKQLQFSLPK